MEPRHQGNGLAKWNGGTKWSRVTNGMAAQTSICWRLKARPEPGRTDGGWQNGWDDALYGK